MKKLLLFIFLLLPLMASKSVTEPIKDCKCKGIKLYGKVKIVEAFEDFRVRKVEAFEDLQVRLTEQPTECGQWHIVEAFEDFRVRYVEAFEDFCVRFVE